MIRANISTTKNKLSSYLERIKQGETLIILERDKPIATLLAYCATEVSKKWDSRISFLSKNLKVTLPKNSKRKILQPPVVSLRPAKLVQALLEERATGR